MFKYFFCHLLEAVPLRAGGTSHSVDCTETERGCGSLHVLVFTTHGGLYGDSLLELLVVSDPVADDADHFAQLGHHLLLLLRL